ncbi:hypothetical protein KJ780_02985 [Candidatus Micrarchaeota archaeon]|nr:hypothetical protein [Candidatus Micrarchaeota archaeon]
MDLLTGSFGAFAKRVMHAVRMGKLSEQDVKALEMLLEKTGTRYTVLSRATVNMLGEGDEGKQDMREFVGIIEAAGKRINQGKTPLSEEDKGKLQNLFVNHQLSLKAAKNFALSIDAVLVGELLSQMKEKDSITPKKTVDSDRRVTV